MTDQPTGVAADKPLDMDLSPGQFHLVEASAGTGKTWLTTALVLRLVAEEGLRIERILVMTFTRAATAELADRVRARLRAALEALETGVSPDPKDAAFQRLLAHPDRASFPERLRAALADFDLAPISTIHGFCQRTLARYALEAGLDPRPEMITDTAPLRERLVADSVVTTWSGLDGPGATVLGELKFEADVLREMAKKFSGAVAPTIDPPVGSTEAPRTLPEAYLSSLATLREVMRERGDACWGAYQESGKDFLKDFGGGQKGAYGTLMKTVGAAKVDGFTLQSLRWFSLEEVHALQPLDRFDGYPLMQAFTPVRRAALALLKGTGPTAAFAHAFRGRWEALLDARGALTYDSMLAALARALDPRQPGAARLRTALAREYDAALVDEFQDTDAAQWLALREVFRAPDKRLVVVGDPKQAIYSFRGADIEVYTAATRSNADGGDGSPGPKGWSLPGNFRTDPRLVNVLHALWSDGAPGMGDKILFPLVEAKKPDRVHTWGTVAERARRPLELRLFTSRMVGAKEDDWVSKDDALGPLAEDCARVCAEIIGTMEISPRPNDTPPSAPFKVAARHVAVLVRTGKQGQRVLQALRKVGIHAVLSSRESVFAGDAARWLVAWLDAVADPGREAPARLLALTPLVGFEPLELGHAVLQQEQSDAAPKRGTPAARFEKLRRHLRRDAEVWPKRGFMSLFERFLAERGAWERVRRAPAGERAATDLRQLIEVLHAEERAERDGVASLAARVRARFAAASAESGGDDPAAQHLESDADAVRILTQHVSKGLQFPVVLLPYGWAHHSVSDDGQPLRLRGQPDANGLPRPRFNVAAKNHPSREDAKTLAQTIEDEEAMRLLYVAMTRAEHHLVAWVGRPSEEPNGALDRRLETPQGLPEAVRERLRALATTYPDLGWTEVPPLSAPTPRAKDEDGTRSAPTYAPPIERLRNGWLKTSYSGLSRTLKVEPSVDDALTALLATPSDMLAAPAAGAVLPRGGTVTGSFVHGLLEVLDFKAPGDDAALAATLKRVGQENGFVDEGQQAIVRGLLPGWLDTPLDRAPDTVAPPLPTGAPALPDGFRLRQVGRKDRLDELGFDLSLGGKARIRPAAARAVFEAVVACDTLRPGTREWARTLLARTNDKGEHPAIVGALQGVLNGSIDLVFRTGTAAVPVFWLADYKTNAIRGPKVVQEWAEARRDAEGSPPDGAPWRDPLLRALHYTTPVLDWEMAHHNYPLQTLLYTVALDRYLRQRLGGTYAYDTHVGGCLWLFLRGMGGADTTRHAGDALGVWRERWPLPLVRALDGALDGDSVADVHALLSDPTPRSRA